MYDTIIIGSGCAGLSAAIYTCRAQLKMMVAEKNYNGTGQISDSERVDNYPGLFGENGFELGQKFRNHALELGAEFYEGEAEEITRNENGYSVKFKNAEVFDTKTIIYAAGTSYRKLGIPGEQEFTGKGVSYCAVCDGAFFKNRIVAVIGGGDTALSDAIFLSKIAEKVYLVHRRNEFRANKTLQGKVKTAENIEVVLEAVPKEISGNGVVNLLKINQNNKEITLDVNGVFVAVGSIPNSQILNGVVDLDKNGYVVAGEDGITSANGIFAAGDVRTKLLRQVVTAASDGANCAFSVENYIY